MTQLINKNTMDDLKQQLLATQAQVQSERDSLRTDERSGTEEGQFGDSADYDPNDPADEATNLFERDRNNAALENADRILRKIARALQKMEEGTYGLSDVDGSPIPTDRLRALPYALATVQQEEKGY